MNGIQRCIFLRGAQAYQRGLLGTSLLLRSMLPPPCSSSQDFLLTPNASMDVPLPTSSLRMLRMARKKGDASVERQYLFRVLLRRRQRQVRRGMQDAHPKGRVSSLGLAMWRSHTLREQSLLGRRPMQCEVLPNRNACQQLYRPPRDARKRFWRHSLRRIPDWEPD